MNLMGQKVHLPEKVASEWQWKASDVCGKGCYVSLLQAWQLT